MSLEKNPVDAGKLAVQGAASDSSRTATEHGEDSDKSSPYLVAFVDPTDKSNPLNWSKSYKWTVVVILSTVTLIGYASTAVPHSDSHPLTSIRNFATVMCIPAVPQILSELHESSSLYGPFLVSAWELGQAVGPLFTAPLSEIFGRAPVFNVANALFVIFSIACAVSSNPGMLIAFRFINGIGDASIALNASIVGDLFQAEERGLAMAVMGFPPLLGPVMGPIIGGYLTEALGWRWAFWLAAIIGGTCALAFFVTYRETYAPRILRRKAHQMRKSTGDDRWHSVHDFTAESSATTILLDALRRPATIMVKSPVVLLLAIYMSAVYGFLYILLTTITEVFEGQYNFSQGAAGLAYLGLSLGMVAGVILCATTLDWYFNKRSAHTGVQKPEYRLPPMVLGGMLIPVGLFLYGWTAEYKVFYIVPMVGTATMGFGFFVTSIPLQTYLVDAFKTFAASAISGTVVLRCLVGALLPLAGPPLYQRLGYGWGNSLLGFVALAFVPLPLVLMSMGERMRRRTKSKLME